jgi:2-dehydropantoate 2-reductase
MAPRFVVVGAGAVGCHVGGKLALAGAAVTFVARPGMAARLAHDGLAIGELGGGLSHLAPDRFAVTEAMDEAGAAPGPAFVMLCTKSGATSTAAAAIAAAFPSGTPVLSLQNGVDNVARIRAAAPGLGALAGMVPYNVVLEKPASGPVAAHRATSGELHAADAPATRAVAPDFARAGLPLTLCGDMAAVQWGKLLLNLNNPVNALSGLPLREELLDPGYRTVLAALQREALGIMAKAGIRPARVGAAPPALIPMLLGLPTWAFTRVAARMLTIDPRARSSMWDDMAAGRPTEIDDLCGAVVRLAAGKGGQAPLNAAMTKLVEQAEKPGGYSGLALARALGLAGRT